MKIRITGTRVPFWRDISDDRVCSGQAVRVPVGTEATIIEGTKDRPLVEAFYPAATPCWAWMMPGDFELIQTELF